MIGDKYKLAICDDSQADAEYIARLVKKWAGDRIIQVKSYPSAEAFLFHYAEEKDYDILLLDIEMGEMDGVTMARTVRRENESVQIVFITGYSDYIAEGYEVAALHYLVKPVKEEKLFQVLDRAAERLKKNEGALLLESSGETVRLPYHEIRYLEVRQNYVTVHGRENVTVKRSLGDFEKELDERFFRLGRSFIINLNHVRRVTKTEVHLSDGTAIPLPRGQYEPLNRAIIQRT